MDSIPVTRLLGELGRGDSASEQQLLDAIYRELHQLAQRAMRSERYNLTLQPSALVNEAYMRMRSQLRHEWQNRSHFYAVAARMMRQILIDHARTRNTQKRGTGQRMEALRDSDGQFSCDPEEILSIHEALERLAVMSQRQAQIVELRFFAGLNVEETAETMNISEKTVKRDWSVARAWLAMELGKV